MKLNQLRRIYNQFKTFENQNIDMRANAKKFYDLDGKNDSE